MATPRYACLELENSQGNESTTSGVFGTKWYLPAQEVDVNPQPKPLNRDDEQRGADGHMPVARNEYAPDGTIKLRGYPNYLGAVLMLLFGDVTTTAGGGGVLDPDGGAVAAGAYKHVFSKLAGATPKSGRVTTSYGDVGWFQARGVTVEEIAFAIAETGVDATAKILANYTNRLLSDPGLTPAYDSFAILPLRRRNAALHTNLGETAKTETLAFTLKQNLEAVWDLGARSGFPGYTDRANSPDGFLGLTGTITRRSLDVVDWDALIQATAFAATISFQSEQNIGSSGTPYGLWLESPYCQYTDGTLEALKQQPRHQNQITWQAGIDPDAGYDFKVTLVNGVAAYK